jgi:hypothetical protein
MPQDQLQRAKEVYQETKEAWRENHRRMREDLLFGDPAVPQQWDQEALGLRKGRPCMTLDRTNQYRMQVVNEARKNKPGLNAMPVDGRGDVAVAQQLDGMLRHIEYRSRAQIAYDWAVQGAADCGVGWIRVVPKVIDPATNRQEICITRVIDHLSIVIDGTEPDGSDAMNAFAETLVTKRNFKREFPKATVASWDTTDSSWITEQDVLVLEHQYVVETTRNMIVVEMPDGDELTLGEDEYWDLVKRIGFQPQFVRNFEATDRSVRWCKFNRDELLEETDFPGRWLGMVPVIGYESYVDGKRRLCGVTRRMMEGQRAYNYERSAGLESVAMQPKAPVMVPAESMEGHEEAWGNMNKGNPAVLTFNALDGNGNQLPAPKRLEPPQYPAAFAQGSQMALADMEGAIGMNRSNLGQPGNATSGRQERERKEQGATATFHFPDNQARSIEQVARIVVGMIPIIYDTKRQAKILGLDGKQSEVTIDPKMPQAVAKRGKKVVAINPTVGEYDVRVKPGPNYTTQREEMVEGLAEGLRAAPAMAPVLVPAMMKLRDWPDAERYSRMLMAMAPPEVQAAAAEGEEDEEDIPPQAQAAMRRMQQQMQQMAQMLDAAEPELQRLQAENQQLKADRGLETARLAAEMEADEANEDTARYRAETERLKAVGAMMPTQTLQADNKAPAQQPQQASAPGPAAGAMGADMGQVLQALLQRQEQTEALLAQIAAALGGQAQPPQPAAEPQPQAV